MQKTGAAEFSLQPPVVVLGPQYTRVNLMVMEGVRAVRVDFHPGGLYRLLGIPMKELFDEGFDACDILGADAADLHERLLNTPEVDQCKNLIENYLIQKLKKLKESLPFDIAARHLLSKNGNIPVEQIASIACLSFRQFERKCWERLGMPPKAFSRIARFSKAYRLKEANPGFTWTSIAYEAGYFDQMHMIRDFKEFAGVTPRLIEDALSGTPFRMQAKLVIGD